MPNPHITELMKATRLAQDYEEAHGALTRNEVALVFSPDPTPFKAGSVPISSLGPSLSAIAAYLATAVVEDVTGTTYTALLADNGKIKRFTNASAIVVTLPKSFGVGVNIAWLQSGAGQITFAAEGGGTLANINNQTKSGGAKASGGLFVEANSDGSSAAWLLSGATGS